MARIDFRIDDRLLHGQVVENWLETLRPDLVVVANDRAAADPFIRELWKAALPPGIALAVEPLTGAGARVNDSSGRVLVIAGTAADALVLVRGGISVAAITVGGIHHAGGRERVLDFVYLDAADRAALHRLLAAGITLVAQDVPSRRPTDLAPLLGPPPATGDD
jgi:mannose/fructose/N-acetylgalactosamine-specific phosphotransferase system component IIB